MSSPSENFAGIRVAPGGRDANQIGSWRLTRLLGQGAVTRVFQAAPADREGIWPADYVVKTLTPNAPQAMGKRLIRREAYASRAASSPHLPALLHACCNGSEPFLVFPYLAGGSLEERLSRYGAPPPILAFWLVRQTLAALRALHDAGWAHGDIKPANILIGQDLHTTLIDLGFAQRLQTDGDRAELKMFTPGYAAPEIHREATATRESDLYSLGVTLFEALCGRRPFYGTTPAELAEAHWMETPPDIRKLNANVPFETAKLLRRMLAKDPSERPSLDAAEEDILRLEIECFDRRAA